MSALRLNKQLEPDRSGQIILQRNGEKLHGWYESSPGVRKHFNAFTFGEAFDLRGFRHADISHVRDFLLQSSLERDEYVARFPRRQQIELMNSFLWKEHGLSIADHRLDVLCELYEQLYPIFWRYVATASSCILSDGFYGASSAEAYLPYQSASSYRELIEIAFGVARKDTLRQGRNVDAVALNLAYVFKELLPVEHIIEDLSSIEGYFGEFPAEPELYAPLLRLSPVVRRRLLVDIILDYKLDSVLIVDALELLTLLPQEKLKRLKGVRSWNQLHRLLMSHCDVIIGDERGETREVFSRLVEPICGISFTQLITAEDFVNAGDWLDLCLGKAGYFMRGLRGTSFCFIGNCEGRPYAALELAELEGSWRVMQLRKRDNHWLENNREVIQLIEQRLNHI